MNRDDPALDAWTREEKRMARNLEIVHATPGAP